MSALFPSASRPARARTERPMARPWRGRSHVIRVSLVTSSARESTRSTPYCPRRILTVSTRRRGRSLRTACHIPDRDMSPAGEMGVRFREKSGRDESSATPPNCRLPRQRAGAADDPVRIRLNGQQKALLAITPAFPTRAALRITNEAAFAFAGCRFPSAMTKSSSKKVPAPHGSLLSPRSCEN